MKILPYKTAKSNRNITARAGLTVPAALLERFKLGEIIDQQMPARAAIEAIGTVPSFISSC